MPTPSTEQPATTHKDAAVRHIVGIAALRRLRKLVDEDAAQTQRNHAKARLLLPLILISAAAGLGFLLRSLIFA